MTDARDVKIRHNDPARPGDDVTDPTAHTCAHCGRPMRQEAP